MATLINTVNTTGTYDSLDAPMSSTEVSTLLVDDMDLQLTADKAAWLQGKLTYTATVINNSTEDYETVSMLDTLDPALISLDATSVERDGTPLVLDTDFTYVAATGLLTIPLATVAGGATTVITFQVSKK